MCAVSMVTDHWGERFLHEPVITTSLLGELQISRAEFDALKKEVEHMKQLLIKAKLYDESSNEPNCEMEEKVDMLRKIAAAVGVDPNDVFGDKRSFEREERLKKLLSMENISMVSIDSKLEDRPEGKCYAWDKDKWVPLQSRQKPFSSYRPTIENEEEHFAELRGQATGPRSYCNNTPRRGRERFNIG